MTEHTNIETQREFRIKSKSKEEKNQVNDAQEQIDKSLNSKQQKNKKKKKKETKFLLQKQNLLFLRFENFDWTCSSDFVQKLTYETSKPSHIRYL